MISRPRKSVWHILSPKPSKMMKKKEEKKKDYADWLGIRGIPLKLLEGYHTGRKQREKINDRLNDELTVNFGVLQGSIIGPTSWYT